MTMGLSQEGPASRGTAGRKGNGVSTQTGPRPSGNRGAGGVSTEAGAAPGGGKGTGLSMTSTAGKAGGQAGRKGDGLSEVKPGHSKAASPGSTTRKGRGVSTASSSKGKGGK